MPNTGSKVAPEERLVNLVVALLATDQGLTKDTILGSVSGYREQSEAGASKDALEKMFERDKESLRSLGVPIETLGDYADPDDLREARYRIATDDYALPDEVSLTAAEAALLDLAGTVWHETSLSVDARAGLRKIRALGIPTTEPLGAYAPRISVRDAAFAPLQRAIETARVVAFYYLKPGEHAPRARRARPLALLEYEARWHLHAHDLDADAPRTFLLSRIVGDVAVTRVSFDPGLRAGAGERARALLDELAASQSALVEVHPGTEAALRLARRASPAAQGLRIPFVDAHVLADELASYGPEVRVVEPAELRRLVVSRLRAALARSGGSA